MIAQALTEIRHAAGCRGGGYLDAIHDRWSFGGACSGNLTLRFEDIQSCAPVAIKGQASEELFLAGRKDGARLTPLENSPHRQTFRPGVPRHDDMASGAALRFMACDDVAMGKVPKAGRDFFATLCEHRSISPHRFNRYNLAVH